MSFENSKGKTYLNLPEQVAYVSNVLEGTKVKKITATNFNADNLSVNNTANIAGALTVSGTTELGSNVEIDGNLIVNSPEDVAFKEDNSTLNDKISTLNDKISTLNYKISTLKIYQHHINFGGGGNNGALIGYFDIYSFDSQSYGSTYSEIYPKLSGKIFACSGVFYQYQDTYLANGYIITQILFDSSSRPSFSGYKLDYTTGGSISFVRLLSSNDFMTSVAFVINDSVHQL